jgi:hypothetical protein
MSPAIKNYTGFAQFKSPEHHETLVAEAGGYLLRSFMRTDTTVKPENRAAVREGVKLALQEAGRDVSKIDNNSLLSLVDDYVATTRGRELLSALQNYFRAYLAARLKTQAQSKKKGRDISPKHIAYSVPMTTRSAKEDLIEAFFTHLRVSDSVTSSDAILAKLFGDSPDNSVRRLHDRELGYLLQAVGGTTRNILVHSVGQANLPPDPVEISDETTLADLANLLKLTAQQVVEVAQYRAENLYNLNLTPRKKLVVVAGSSPKNG